MFFFHSLSELPNSFKKYSFSHLYHSNFQRWRTLLEHLEKEQETMPPKKEKKAVAEDGEMTAQIMLETLKVKTKKM